LFLLPFPSSVDFEDPDTEWFCKVGFATAQVVQACVLFFVYQKIMKKADTTEITVPATASLGSPPPQPGETHTCSVAEYDVQQIKKQLTQIVFSSAIIGFLNYNWNYVQPLFIQMFMSPMQLMKHPLVKLHIFGDDTVNRPFEEPSPFAAFMPQDPAAAGAAAPAVGAAAPAPSNDDDDDDDEDDDEVVSATPNASKAKRSDDEDDAKAFEDLKAPRVEELDGEEGEEKSAGEKKSD
jgi:Phosphate transport (Pho88)